MPGEDVARLLLAVELPPGSPLSQTMKVTDSIVERLQKMPEVKTIFVDGGKIGLGAAEVRKAQFVINLVNKTKRSKSQKVLQREIGDQISQIPDIRNWFLNDNGMRAVSLTLSGTDNEAVERTGALLQSEMKRIPLISNVVSTASLDRPEIRIKPNLDKAAELGVSTDLLAEVIRVATIGDADANLAHSHSRGIAGIGQRPSRYSLEFETTNFAWLHRALIRTGRLRVRSGANQHFTL